MQKAYLTLADGCVYTGYAFGYQAEAEGEIVFTTSAIGYLETITDPSYYGQIVVQAFPLVGNCGFISEDLQTNSPKLSAYIVRDLCTVPSNFRTEGTLDEFLKNSKIPGIYGIDTRSLIRHVRDAGTMGAKITYEAPDVDAILPTIKNYAVKNAVLSVSRCERETIALEGAKYRVAVWDFGSVGKAADLLTKKGCEVTLFPADSKAEDILSTSPDGIVLTDGPGDPAENVSIIKELSEILDKKLPVFGFGLGHQLVALARGGKTDKLKYGHRGANQPVCREEDGRVFSTSQNHGYVVLPDTLPQCAKVTYRNINDNTCEGVEYTCMPTFTVQFIPSECDGPQNTGYLYDKLIEMMEGGKN